MSKYKINVNQNGSETHKQLGQGLVRKQAVTVGGWLSWSIGD